MERKFRKISLTKPTIREKESLIKTISFLKCQDKFRMSFDAKVAEDAPFRYDWLQVSTTIPKKPSESLSATYYSQEEVRSTKLIVS